MRVSPGRRDSTTRSPVPSASMQTPFGYSETAVLQTRTPPSGDTLTMPALAGSSSPLHETYSVPVPSNAQAFGVSSSSPAGPRANVMTSPEPGSKRTTSPLPASQAYTRPRPSTASPSIEPSTDATPSPPPPSVTAQSSPPPPPPHSLPASRSP